MHVNTYKDPDNISVERFNLFCDVSIVKKFDIPLHIEISDSYSKYFILYGRGMLYRMHNLFRLFFQLLRNVFIFFEILFREEATVYISNHKNHLRTQPFGSLAKTRCLAIRSFSPTLSLIFPKNSGIWKTMVLKLFLITLLIKVRYS